MELSLKDTSVLPTLTAIHQSWQHWQNAHVRNNAPFFSLRWYLQKSKKLAPSISSSIHFLHPNSFNLSMAFFVAFFRWQKGCCASSSSSCSSSRSYSGLREKKGSSSCYLALALFCFFTILKKHEKGTQLRWRKKVVSSWLRRFWRPFLFWSVLFGSYHLLWYTLRIKYVFYLITFFIIGNQSK